jgi:hypothetical protein
MSDDRHRNGGGRSGDRIGPTTAFDPMPPLSFLRAGHSRTRMRTVVSGLIGRGKVSAVSIVRTDVNSGVFV